MVETFTKYNYSMSPIMAKQILNIVCCNGRTNKLVSIIDKKFNLFFDYENFRPHFEALKADKLEYAKSFYIQYSNTDPFSGKRLFETYGSTSRIQSDILIIPSGCTDEEKLTVCIFQYFTISQFVFCQDFTNYLYRYRNGKIKSSSCRKIYSFCLLNIVVFILYKSFQFLLWGQKVLFS